MKQECIVLLRGQLRGMDRTEDCELLARRRQRPGPPPVLRSYDYSECIVLSAPADLPDGDYMLFFAGHSTVVIRTRGLWSSFGAVIPDSSANGFDEGRPVDPGALATPHSDEKKSAPEAPSAHEKTNRSLDRQDG